jgi:hypothetical protein
MGTFLLVVVGFRGEAVYIGGILGAEREYGIGGLFRVQYLVK